VRAKERSRIYNYRRVDFDHKEIDGHDRSVD
jgi:hypothetical protein